MTNTRSKEVSKTRDFAPMLQPARYAVQASDQYDLFWRHVYMPPWFLENLPVTNPDPRIFVPPTTIQVKVACDHIKKHSQGAPRARSRRLGAFQLFVQGHSLCDVVLYVHTGHLLAMCCRFFQLLLGGARPRELVRQLKLETMLTYSAPGAALGACRKYLNGF